MAKLHGPWKLNMSEEDEYDPLNWFGRFKRATTLLLSGAYARDSRHNMGADMQKV